MRLPSLSFTWFASNGSIMPCAAMRRIHLSDLMVTRVLPSADCHHSDRMCRTMKTKALAWGALAALVALCPLAGAAAEDPPPFTQDEIRAILAHGPWPVPLAADPGTRVSAKREAG